MNYTTLNDNGNLNLYTNNGHHYKYSQIFNFNKKLSLIDIENNNGKISSPYNVYYKKKTQPNSTENSFIKNKLKNKISITKNINSNKYLKLLDNSAISNLNNINNKNIYVSKNHLSKHKNLSSLNNSIHMVYNNNNQTGITHDNNHESEIISPKNTNNNNTENHKYQKTEDIIVNNYNININNQINNTNNFISGNFIQYD
jgi:hypothetical protein